jgi:hypothetical protein
VVEVPSESRSRERLEIAEARYRANGGLVGAILDRYKVGTVLVLAIGADDPLPDRWDARQRALAGEIDVLVIHPQSHPAVAAHVGLLAQMAINAEILRLVDGELVAEVTS